MSAPLPQPPDGNFLPWVIQHPEQVAAYLERVRATQNLTLTVTKDGITKSYIVQWSASNGIISINL